MPSSTSGDADMPENPGEPAATPPRRTAASRRDLLRWSAIAAMAAAAGPLLPSLAHAETDAGAGSGTGSGVGTRLGTSSSTANLADGYPTTKRAAANDSTFSPLRPPATPLAVRSPYLSAWQASDTLTGAWSSFWNGRVTALCGIARIDGTPYLFAGEPSIPAGPALTTMSQTSLQVTSTQSVYTLTGGGVTLTVNFFSPVELGNLQRQCVPFSYITAQAASSDGGAHTVELYFDISGEWAHGDSTQDISWSQQQTSATTALSFTPTNPSVLAEDNDQASWGTVVFASPTNSALTFQIGQDQVVRALAASTGSLADSVDTNQPRPIDDDWPVFAFCSSLGTVTSSGAAALFQVVIGHVRTPSVSYLGTNLNAWWTNYWGDWPDMVDWFVADYSSALASANALDQQIETDANNAVGGGTVGSQYAALCALALRQAVGGTELVDYGGSPWAMLKEISSDGNVSTVDVVYPASPAYLYLSPAYLQLLLEPLVAYAENGWIEQFAEHDLGPRYPVASGGVSKGQDTQEDMPVEESGNMLIMVAALLQRLPSAQASAFAQQHYAILRQWAEYLLPNALDPGLQNQTDDFTGPIANSANLAVKGILGIGAMSLIAGIAGNSGDQASFLNTAFSYISQWVSLGEDPSGPHLDLAYGDSGSWSLKYNAFPDRLLGLGIVPLGVQALEASWYQSNAGTYGVLLDPRNDYTKADWELWTASWLADQTSARNTLIQGVYGFLDNTAQRVPFTDLYVVATAAQVSFQARPVVGGMFGLLLSPTAPTTTWYKVQNYNSGLLLAVSGMSLADSADVTQWEDNGTVDHLWTILDNGDGTVRIANRNSGKVLAVNDMSTADGAFVQQYQDNGTADHNWQIVDAGNGWSKIVNMNSGKLMAVSGMSTADGAQVTQWDDNGTADHLWQFVQSS